MIFAKRQITSLQRAGVVAKSFFLASRVSPLLLLQDMKRFRREVITFKPDIVHAQYGTVTAFFSAVTTQLPLVITFRGSDLNPCPSIFWLRSAVGRCLSQIASLRATQIICASQELKERLWWVRGRAVVIPTGVDTELFFSRPPDQARAELGWKTEERVVLFNAGREHMVKRLDLAQPAISVARSICKDIRFVVLDGSVEPKIIPTMMSAADCLLLTSDWEGSPTVVQEAMACNLPVVSVDVGDVKERLAGIHPSRIVRRDPIAIGKALAEVVLSGERSNGHTAVQELALNRIACRLVAIYQEILEKKRWNTTQC